MRRRKRRSSPDSQGTGTESTESGPAVASDAYLLDKGPAVQHSFWTGGVLSREAVLGRALVSLGPHGNVADALAGQMLSSKQITRCAAMNASHLHRINDTAMGKG